MNNSTTYAFKAPRGRAYVPRRTEKVLKQIAGVRADGLNDLTPATYAGYVTAYGYQGTRYRRPHNAYVVDGLVCAVVKNAAGMIENPDGTAGAVYGADDHVFAPFTGRLRCRYDAAALDARHVEAARYDLQILNGYVVEMHDKTTGDVVPVDPWDHAAALDMLGYGDYVAGPYERKRQKKHGARKTA